MKINKNRVQELIEQYNQYSKAHEVGIYRLALSEEDKNTRDLLKYDMQKLGLQVFIDPIGNMIGIQKDKLHAPLIALGSHLDSVANGGKYDGVLGIVAALVILETLAEQGFHSDKGLAIINFTNEEGNRFAPDMMGSAVFAGVETLENVYPSPALDGTTPTLKEALDQIGYRGDFDTSVLDIKAFLELHIEQGPILEQAQIPIGVVEKVQGIYWTEYTFEGIANHAGTTPMKYRKNAGLGAAELILKAHDLSIQYQETQVMNVGKLEFAPNQPNIVPAIAKLIIDQRNPDAEILEEVQKELDQIARAIAKKYDLKLFTQDLVRFQPIDFSPQIVSVLEECTQGLGYPYLKMRSGAGHDAQLMAHRYPAAMVFVPSKDGISHNPAEHTDLDDMVKGIEVMLQAVLKLFKD